MTFFSSIVAYILATGVISLSSAERCVLLAKFNHSYCVIGLQVLLLQQRETVHDQVIVEKSCSLIALLIQVAFGGIVVQYIQNTNQHSYPTTPAHSVQENIMKLAVNVDIIE